MDSQWQVTKFFNVQSTTFNGSSFYHVLFPLPLTSFHSKPITTTPSKRFLHYKFVSGPIPLPEIVLSQTSLSKYPSSRRSRLRDSILYLNTQGSYRFSSPTDFSLIVLCSTTSYSHLSNCSKCLKSSVSRTVKYDS